MAIQRLKDIFAESTATRGSRIFYMGLFVAMGGWPLKIAALLFLAWLLGELICGRIATWMLGKMFSPRSQPISPAIASDVPLTAQLLLLFLPMKHRKDFLQSLEEEYETVRQQYDAKVARRFYWCQVLSAWVEFFATTGFIGWLASVALRKMAG